MGAGPVTHLERKNFAKLMVATFGYKETGFRFRLCLLGSAFAFALGPASSQGINCPVEIKVQEARIYAISQGGAGFCQQLCGCVCKAALPPVRHSDEMVTRAGTWSPDQTSWQRYPAKLPPDFLPPHTVRS